MKSFAVIACILLIGIMVAGINCAPLGGGPPRGGGVGAGIRFVDKQRGVSLGGRQPAADSVGPAHGRGGGRRSADSVGPAHGRGGGRRSTDRATAIGQFL